MESVFLERFLTQGKGMIAMTCQQNEWWFVGKKASRWITGVICQNSHLETTMDGPNKQFCKGTANKWNKRTITNVIGG